MTLQMLQNPIATFETTHGNFSAEIMLSQMPITASNFIDLANGGFYDQLHFHRVIRGFLVQALHHRPAPGPDLRAYA